MAYTHNFGHIRDNAVDWPHHDALRAVEIARKGGGRDPVWDSLALRDITNLVEEGNTAGAVVFARAYASAWRAVEIEMADLSATREAVRRERQAVTS